MRSNSLNTARFAANPRHATVLFDKVRRRFTDPYGSIDPAENKSWLQRHAIVFDELARSIDADLWRETQEYAGSLKTYADKVLGTIPVKLGGAGNYPLMYFAVRRLKPNTVVETGVAAGYTSAATLAALQGNHTGHLHSSDFPYFRLESPEQYIGAVIAPDLRDRWTLHTEGDRRALPRIAAQVANVDVFHYDSDKSYTGRQFALQTLSDRFTPETLIVFDDVQDNAHFYDTVKLIEQTRQWQVFEFEGKYMGTIGPL